MPPVNFTSPARDYAKDCWVVKNNFDDEDEIPVIMTICKSADDETETLNADASQSQELDEYDEDGEPIIKASVHSTKIRA